MPKLLITNADEFGLTEEVNEGILETYKEGIVTSSTMIVNMWAFDHAVSLARREPGLSIGVHLNLTDGSPVLPAAAVPSLVDGEGRFYRRPVLVRRLVLGQIRMDEVRAEFKAQVDRLREAGICPQHLDSHQSIHMFPSVFRVASDLAQEQQLALRLPAERLPRESFSDWRSYVAYMSRGAFLKNRLFFSLAGRRRRALQARGVITSDYFISTMGCYRQNPRNLTEALQRALQTLEDGVTELMTHPGFVDRRLNCFVGGGEEEAQRRLQEARALTSPGLKALLSSGNITLINYGHLVGHPELLKGWSR